MGLGCNNFGGRMDLNASRAVIHAALDVGITFFDTADAYGNDSGSERALGEVLGARRNEIVLATKFGRGIENRQVRPGSSRRYIISAVEGSLRRLKTDRIDLYQAHYPDPVTPVEETLRALDDLVRDGKVLYIGTSNHRAWQIVEAELTARAGSLERFVSAQDEYSPVVRDIEGEIVPVIQKYGIGLIAYRTLASGLLSGKYKRGEAPPPGTRLAAMQHHANRYLSSVNMEITERLRLYAESRSRSMIELAFAWVASHAFVSAIIVGASSPLQVRENVAAMSRTLSKAELAEVDQLIAGANASTA
jgi:aryl-alcohol dehydrogenase-like predicted oxidoreductase